MQNPTSLIVHTLLTQLGVLTGAGSWGMSWVRTPTGSGNDNFITIAGTTGIIQASLIDKNNSNQVKDATLEGFQIKTRSKDYLTGYKKMEQIRVLLLQIQTQSIVVSSVNTMLHMFQMAGQIMPLGQEELERRENFSSNWLMSATEY